MYGCGLNWLLFLSCYGTASIFARLACVKHAASVHPEPGSNSHKNVFLSETHARLLAQLAKSLKTRVLNPVSFELTSFNSFLILCLRIHSIA